MKWRLEERANGKEGGAEKIRFKYRKGLLRLVMGDITEREEGLPNSAQPVVTDRRETNLNFGAVVYPSFL